MSGASAAQIAARLDRIPASRALWSIVVLISLGGAFEFYDIFFPAYVAPGMQKSGLFTVDSLGVFASLKALQVAGFGTFVFSTFMGLWVGVVALSQAADRFGRKAVFTASLLWYVAATAIMAFQHSGEGLNVWRFIAGVGFGVQLVTIDTYLVELVPAGLRGRAFSTNQCICFTAVPLVALLAWLLVPSAPLGLEGWRWVVLLGSVGAIAVWALRSGIPESPRWLAAQGRLEEADRVVSDIERRVLEELGSLPPVGPEAARANAAPRARLADIFRGRYRGRTLMLSIFNAAQVIGFLGALFADRVERKTQIVGGLACMGLAMAAFARASSPALLITIGIVFTLAANTRRRRGGRRGRIHWPWALSRSSGRRRGASLSSS